MLHELHHLAERKEARASAVAGDEAAAREWRARAEAELAKIAHAEDRQVIEQDLATLPL